MLLCVVGLAVVVGAAMASGAVPGLRGGDGSAHPPCEKLPAKTDVTQAVASHRDLETQIRAAGPGVRVDVHAPCGDMPDRALVRITYGTGDERARVETILREQTGFGAPVQLVES